MSTKWEKMLRSLFCGGAFFLALFSSGTAAWGADVSCEPDAAITVETQTVTYYGPFETVATDARADKVGSKYVIELKGLLFYPQGTVKNAPVVIYNHGYEQDRGIPGAIRDYFVKRGFVLFAPLRRGHLYDDEIFSTGIHIEEYVDKCMRSQANAQNDSLPHLFCSSVFCRNQVPCAATNKDNAVEVDYLRSQWVDVEAQVDFILNHPAINDTGKLADPNKIAIMGHSFGGSMIIFANEHEMGQNVAIDISGAEKSWNSKNPWWKPDLLDAMTYQKRPMYLLQPRNGRTLAPTKVLSGKAIDKKYRVEAAIFPPAPWDPDCVDKNKSCWDDEKDELKPEWEQAHSTFIGNDEQVEKWGCSVIEFVNRYPLPILAGD